MDPFLIDGPTSVSFSDSRTSEYILRRVLDAHGGTLPHDARVVFANTGKEREETLVFVEEVSQRWGVPVEAEAPAASRRGRWEWLPSSTPVPFS